jgi:hypothetical protein
LLGEIEKALAEQKVKGRMAIQDAAGCSYPAPVLTPSQAAPKQAKEHEEAETDSSTPQGECIKFDDCGS